MAPDGFCLSRASTRNLSLVMFLKNWARLYSKMTEPEKRMEPAVAALGRPYRVQHPFWNLHHFADFVLLQDKVVIEVDGKSHLAPAQRVKDLKHTLALQDMGYTVVRCSNEEALRDPAGTLQKLLLPDSLQKAQLHQGQSLLEIARLEAQIAAKTPRRKAPVRQAKGRRVRRKTHPPLLDATL